MSSMDLIIAPATTVVELAGALGATLGFYLTPRSYIGIKLIEKKQIYGIRMLRMSKERF